MKYSLAIETSGARGSIALGLDDNVLEVRTFESVGRHAAELMPSIAAACEAHDVCPKDINLVFASQGPGSFTGLRLGVTVARMIAWANGAKVVGVPTLEAIAQNALDLPDPPGHVAVVLDARRRKVYAASFALTDQTYQPKSQPAEVDPERFLQDQPPDCAVLGEGVRIHRSAIELTGRPILPASVHAARAEHVYNLGVRLAADHRFIDHREFTPTYVRLPEPEEKWAHRKT